jgi:hypothetical protein
VAKGEFFPCQFHSSSGKQRVEAAIALAARKRGREMSRISCLVGPILVTLFAASQGSAAIVNGSFEAAFVGWDALGNTSDVTGAFGTGPTDGAFQAHMTTGTGAVSSAALESFLSLPAGSLNGFDGFEGSAIRQSFTASAGDVLSFDWNFLTNENTPNQFNDFAFWSLVNQTNAQLLADTNHSFITSNSSFNEETGFSTLSVTIAASGTYTLGFGAMDGLDAEVDSGLLIDNVRLSSSAVPEPSTLIVFSLGCLGTVAAALRRRWTLAT